MAVDALALSRTSIEACGRQRPFWQQTYQTFRIDCLLRIELVEDKDTGMLLEKRTQRSGRVDSQARLDVDDTGTTSPGWTQAPLYRN
jgi:hypothetical protein